jgi:2,4-dienoyl-CoA reductase-like NADH-dependent reductase (Old Yellow Enzyme family)
MVTLFDPIRLGAIEAPNRIIMAPLPAHGIHAATSRRR